MKTNKHLFLFQATLPAILATGILAATLHGAPPASPPVDPAVHAAHVAAGTHPATPAPEAAKGDPALSQQLSQLQAQVAQLEAALAKGAPPKGAGPSMGMGTMKSGGQMGSMASGGSTPATGAGTTSAPAMAGMGGSGSGMNMMGMMDKMMTMMDKMMSMGGGAMPAGGAPMAPGASGGMGGMMAMDSMEMGGMGGGAAPAAGAGMSGMAGGGGMGMMAMDKMEMAGMMGMAPMGGGASGAMPQSALPGFPGASHLYHLGSTGFFLDHKTHIALTTEQTAALNKAKEKAALAKSTADRAIEQAEQELWTLTAADQPDITAIEVKTAEIGKLTGAARVDFIRAVGEASKLLTDAQRKILTGFAPPAPAAPAAAMAPMKGM